ncbi:MAG: hypothetical protein ACR2LV_04980, partial [Solirubrobacteraceae bacterium]
MTSMDTMDRREQREARIARKRERRQARELKQARYSTPVEYAPAPELLRAEAPRLERGGQVSPQPAAELRRAERVESPASGSAPVTAPDGPAMMEPPERNSPVQRSRRATLPSPHIPRRDRDIAAFQERRRQIVALACTEAKERLSRLGEEAAVLDALAALAHPGAA